MEVNVVQYSGDGTASQNVAHGLSGTPNVVILVPKSFNFGNLAPHFGAQISGTWYGRNWDSTGGGGTAYVSGADGTYITVTNSGLWNEGSSTFLAICIYDDGNGDLDVVSTTSSGHVALTHSVTATVEAVMAGGEWISGSCVALHPRSRGASTDATSFLGQATAEAADWIEDLAYSGTQIYLGSTLCNGGGNRALCVVFGQSSGESESLSYTGNGGSGNRSVTIAGQPQALMIVSRSARIGRIRCEGTGSHSNNSSNPNGQGNEGTGHLKDLTATTFVIDRTSAQVNTNSELYEVLWFTTTSGGSSPQSTTGVAVSVSVDGTIPAVGVSGSASSSTVSGTAGGIGTQGAPASVSVDGTSGSTGYGVAGSPSSVTVDGTTPGIGVSGLPASQAITIPEAGIGVEGSPASVTVDATTGATGYGVSGSPASVSVDSTTPGVGVSGAPASGTFTIPDAGVGVQGSPASVSVDATSGGTGYGVAGNPASVSAQTNTPGVGVSGTPPSSSITIPDAGVGVEGSPVDVTVTATQGAAAIGAIVGEPAVVTIGVTVPGVGVTGVYVAVTVTGTQGSGGAGAPSTTGSPTTVTVTATTGQITFTGAPAIGDILLWYDKDATGPYACIVVGEPGADIRYDVEIFELNLTHRRSHSQVLLAPSVAKGELLGTTFVVARS